ncbi:hypothetical protein Leryth_020035 [Lithospermum erythrorhizon]|uniref:Uncharacterized protein n=1 Tax=Lithospermum erythrorhizon TaxID=34254 RepID=A0AAV3QXH7_LITER|nr:hypothetical protein Leryth_020035 [Lithospermum erythrorhizon]
MESINGWVATMEIVKKQTVSEILVSPVPVWMAVVIGVVIGWSWKSTASCVVFFVFSVVKKLCKFLWTLLPGLDAKRVSLAFTAFSVLSLARQLWS